MFAWQVAQSFGWVSALSCFSPFGLCTLWQVMQVTPRASCLLPAHIAWTPDAWQVVQVLSISAAVAPVNLRTLFADGSSACLLPGPWHVSQLLSAPGDLGSADLAWRLSR